MAGKALFGLASHTLPTTPIFPPAPPPLPPTPLISALFSVAACSVPCHVVYSSLYCRCAATQQTCRARSRPHLHLRPHLPLHQHHLLQQSPIQLRPLLPSTPHFLSYSPANPHHPNGTSYITHYPTLLPPTSSHHCPHSNYCYSSPHSITHCHSPPHRCSTHYYPPRPPHLPHYYTPYIASVTPYNNSPPATPTTLHSTQPIVS